MVMGVAHLVFAFGRFKVWLAALAGVLLVFLGVYAVGRRDARQRAAQKADEAYRETRRRIDEVVDDPVLPDDAREWLRRRGERNSDL
jgi:sulfite exporter TauE/SafE